MKNNWKNLQKLLSKSLVLLMFTGSASAYNRERVHSAEQVPEELKGLEIEEKLGSLIDLNLSYTDEAGKSISLSHFFKNQKPVLLTIIYYGCPNLCGLHLSGLSAAIEKLPLSFQKQFEFVAVSMDPTETPKLASEKKKTYLKKYNLHSENLHFLTGKEPDIQKLSAQVGFRFRWDDNQKIFAHLPVAYILTSQGQISRYLYGVEFSPQTLKLSLVEASKNQIGTIMDKILLFCFQFDPNRGLYSWYAYNIMRAGGVFTICLLLGFLLPVWIREKKS